MNKDNMLEMLKTMADGIAETFGLSCETVIHEIVENSHKIVYIRNGEVSGREEGDTKSLIGDDSNIADFYKGKNLINFEARTDTGKMIKSTTFHYKSTSYHFSLGINYDFTMFSIMGKTIAGFIKTSSTYDEVLSNKGDVNIDTLFVECLEEINIPVQMLGKEDRKRIVGMLDAKSAFTIKNSIIDVAERLGVSRYTIYNYLKEIRGE